MSPTRSRGLNEAEVNTSLNVLRKVVRIDEVRNRRSDPSFRDFRRYVADTKFILRSLKKKCRVLDIGAGAGVFSLVLAQLGFEVTAADIAVEDGPEIDFFKRFGCKFVSVNLGEQKLPFPTAEYDAVLCLHVLEHLKKPQAGLTEVHRVLRPTGLLILMTPNGLITSFYKRLRPSKNMQESEHIKEYTLKELLAMLNLSGFKVCGVWYSNEMVSAGLSDAALPKKLLVYSYSFLCKLFPVLAYEIHLAARSC